MVRRQGAEAEAERARAGFDYETVIEERLR